MKKRKFWILRDILDQKVEKHTRIFATSVLDRCVYGRFRLVHGKLILEVRLSRKEKQRLAKAGYLVVPAKK